MKSAAITPHPDYAKLVASALKLSAVVKPWTGQACRAVLGKHAIQGQVLSGVYAAGSGGRWNRPGVQAVYASLEEATVLTEVASRDLRAGFTGIVKFERHIVWFKPNLAKTVDLRDPDALKRLSLDMDELLAADWKAEQSGGKESLPQADGRAMTAVGIEGILVPSAQRREGTNLVIFPLTLLPTSVVEEPPGLKRPQKRTSKE